MPVYAPFDRRRRRIADAEPDPPSTARESSTALATSSTRNQQSARGSVSAQPEGRMPRAAAIVTIVAACIVVAVVAVYCVGCIYFHQRFWPNTHIGDTDVSLMSRAQASEALQRTSDAMQVSVAGQGVSFSLTGENAGLELNVDDAVADALAQIPSWQWPYQIFNDHDASDVLTSSFDTSLLQTTVEAQLASYNSSADDPQDAFVYFDEASGSFQINPGSTGTKLDPERVVDTIVEALTAERDHAPLTSKDLVQQNVKADDPALAAERDAANAYLTCNVQLTLNGTVVANLDPSTVKDWIVFGDGTVTLDETQLVAWVDGIEAKVDSVGTTRSYTRPDGKYVTVSGGDYGWISDGAALEQLVRDCVANGTVGSQEIPLKQSAYQYNPGGQDWGGRYVDIDLSEQYVRYYDWDGSLLWSSVCISGNPNTGHSTPSGVYDLNNKALDQTLIGLTDPATGEPEYRTPVDYWMPFVGNSVGLHDATWQYDWSSSAYTYNGSHGCVNLPWDAASSLYSIIQIGDPVIVHY